MDVIWKNFDAKFIVMQKEIEIKNREKSALQTGAVDQMDRKSLDRGLILASRPEHMHIDSSI